MPESLQEWLLGRDGESYASQKYAFANNPNLELRTVAPHDGIPLEVDTPLPSRTQTDENPFPGTEAASIVQDEPVPTAWIPLPLSSVADIRVVIEEGITTISDIHSIFAPRLRHTDPTHEAGRTAGFISLLQRACRLDKATGTLFLNRKWIREIDMSYSDSHEMHDGVDCGMRISLTKVVGSDPSKYTIVQTLSSNQDMVAIFASPCSTCSFSDG